MVYKIITNKIDDQYNIFKTHRRTTMHQVPTFSTSSQFFLFCGYCQSLLNVFLKWSLNDENIAKSRFT